MRGRTFLVSGVFCVILILSVSMLPELVTNNSSQESLVVYSEPILSSYTPHGPIDIQNDTALASFSVGGTGDPGTPYILEGWNITTINKHGIVVEGTTSHFIIRNCWMKVGGAAGIRLVSLASNTATISNVVVTDSAYGCYVNSAGQTDIEDSIFQNGAWGLYAISSTELDVINCTFFSNSINGIKAQTSTQAFFFENIFTGNAEGLYLEGCDGATLDSNTFVDDGLNLYFSDILGYTSVNLDGNTVNGRDIGYFVSETDTSYKEEYGQVFMIDCLRVTAKALNCSNSIYGAYLRWSSDCEITDSIFNNNHLDGVVILNCDNILSENVTIVGNEGMGFNIWLSDYVNVSYSNITSNAVGVSTGNSDFNRIDHCNISTNGDSISTTGNQNTTIENNTFTDNGEHGLMVDPYGDTTIFGNVFINDGLTLFGSDVQSYLSNIPLITENIVNGQPLGIIANLNDIEISELYGQLIMINCTGVGVSSQNCSNTITGLSALYCSDLEITDCTFSDNKKNGINLIHSDDSSIIGTIGKSNERGIDLLDTTGISVFESIFESNQYGADIYQSTNIIVSECSFNQNLIHGFVTSDVIHLALLTNDFSFNGDSGAFISNTQTALVANNQFNMNTQNGLEIYLSDDIQIFRNWIFNNSYGVSVTDSNFLNFAYNIVLENQDYGIVFSSTNKSSVHHCLFLDNNDGLVQANDDSSSGSIWFDSTSAEGNFWSDYTGSGSYLIDGSTFAIDAYPMTILDIDEDGVDDAWEILNGIDPFSSDSDGDSIPDNYEVENGLDPTTDDTTLDEDEDGLSNLQEYLLGLSANNSDSDGDQMPDLWEVENYLYPLFDDADLDPDGDGISNLGEYLGGTNPHLSDTTPTTTITTTETTTTPTTETTATTTEPTTTTPSMPSTDILPVILALIGGFAIGMLSLSIIIRKVRVKKTE